MLALGPLAAFAPASCAPVEALEPGTCGNGVIDADLGEDCDGQPVSGFPCRTVEETSPCAFACNDAGKCPTGYGCGTDNVCRRPSGSFELSSFAQVASQSEELLAGNFDNDRRADVVAVEPGHVRIQFFGDSGFVQQASFSTPVRPLIGKLGTLTAAKDDAETVVDTTDDLVLPLNLGISALISQGDQTFTAHTYGSIALDLPAGQGGMLFVQDALPLSFNALPDTPDANNTGDETGALVGVIGPGQEVATDGQFVRFSTAGSGPVFTVEGGPPDRLSGPPIIGNFDVDPCEEIAFPLKDESVLRVYKPCVYNAFNEAFEWIQPAPVGGAVLTEIQLAPATIAGPAFVVDTNGDSVADVLVTVSTSQGLQVRVAYGLGNGDFHSEPVPLPVAAGFPADNATSVYATLVPKPLPANGRVPLAFGDINLDGYVDFADSNRIFVGGPFVGGPGMPEPVSFKATVESKRSWTEVVIADVNGNGYPDVLGCTLGARDIDVINGNASDFFNPSQLATDGSVSQLVVADFDGDVVKDVAFQNVSFKNESLLMIAYGRTSGGPEAPLEIGSFPQILRMVAGNAHTFGFDSIADLGVVSRSGDGPLLLSFFPGSGNRFMQAPFLLSDPNTQRVHLPVQAGLGLLKGTAPGESEASHNDLAVVAFEPLPPVENETAFDELVRYTKSLRLWGLFGSGEAELAANQTALCPMPSGSFLFPGLERATSVVVSEEASGKPGRVFVGSPIMKFQGPSGIEIRGMLSEAEFDGVGLCAVGEAYSAALGELFFRVKTADLNGNGKPEVLALKKSFSSETLIAYFALGLTPSGGAFPTAEKSELVVFWDGILGGDNTLMPGLIEGQPERVDDYAVADIDGDRVPDVLAVGNDGLYRYSLGADGVSLVGGPSSELPATNGASTVLVADVSGDGVEDLVLGSNVLQFYRGIPKATNVALPTAGAP